MTSDTSQVSPGAMRVEDTNLDRQENRPDLQCWAPLVFENIKADATQLVNVGMVDPSDESHLKHGDQSWRHYHLNLRQPWEQTWGSPLGGKAPV